MNVHMSQDGLEFGSRSRVTVQTPSDGPMESDSRFRRIHPWSEGPPYKWNAPDCSLLRQGFEVRASREG